MWTLFCGAYDLKGCAWYVWVSGLKYVEILVLTNLNDSELQSSVCRLIRILDVPTWLCV